MAAGFMSTAYAIPAHEASPLRAELRATMSLALTLAGANLLQRAVYAVDVVGEGVPVDLASPVDSIVGVGVARGWSDRDGTDPGSDAPAGAERRVRDDVAVGKVPRELQNLAARGRRLDLDHVGACGARCLEKKLDPHVFFRANRKQMVNLAWVDKIEPWFSGGLNCSLTTGEVVEVSRRQTLRFKELMSL